MNSMVRFTRFCNFIFKTNKSDYYLTVEMPEPPEMNVTPSVVIPLPPTTPSIDEDEELLIEISEDEQDRIEEDRRVHSFDDFPAGLFFHPALAVTKFANAGLRWTACGDHVTCKDCHAFFGDFDPEDTLILRHSTNVKRGHYCNWLVQKVFKKLKINVLLDNKSEPENVRFARMWRRGKLTFLIRYMQKKNLSYNEEIIEESEQRPESEFTCKICHIRIVKYTLFCGHMLCYTCKDTMLDDRDAMCPWCRNCHLKFSVNQRFP